ncbi:MAG: serine endoprotease DegQ, partial [Pseudomonadota bacterium]
MLWPAQTVRAALPGELVDGQPLPSLAPMLERTSPAVVNIATYNTYEVRNPLLEDPFFRRFFNIPNQQRRTRSAGSGVIVDAENGFIVTNNHVVQRA